MIFLVEQISNMTKFEKLELSSQVLKLVGFVYLIVLWSIHVVHHW